MAKKKYTQKEILEMLKKADHELIQKFLANHIKEDASFRQILGEYLDKPSTKKSLAKKFEASIINAIDDAIEDSEGEYGFIDYYSASRFGSRIDEVIERIQTESPTTELRINLQIEVLERIDDIDIDDSSGTLSGIIYGVIDDFKAIYYESDKEDRQLLFDACMDYLYDYESHMDFVADDVEALVLGFDDAEFTEDIECYLNDRIEALSAKDNDSWSREYHIGRYVVTMLNIMSGKGAEENEMLKYAKKYWDSSEVRKWFVQYYKCSGVVDKAIALLEEGLSRDAGYAGLIADYRSELRNLYRQTGKTDKYQGVLVAIIKASYGSEIEAYRELKSLYSGEEWTVYREEVFGWKIDKRICLAEYLWEEKLTDRLAELVLRDDTEYRLFVEYSPKLPKEYRERILSTFERHYTKMAYRVSNRKQYQGLMDTVRDVHKISGGKALTDRLTSQWLVQYKKRRAFCEEIHLFRSRYKSMN